jgi:hypothetical protein
VSVAIGQQLRAYQYGAEKHQLYLKHYERHFKSLAERHINLLELGVYKGGSLLQWRDFFQNGRIVGLDLHPVYIDDSTGRTRTYVGDQRDLQLLERIASECAPDGFDIIIDDASHLAAFTKISFWYLFTNHLKPGGYYVIEDWRVSYSEAWPDGADYEWPRPIRVQPPRSSCAVEPESRLLAYSDRVAGLARKLLDAVGADASTKRLGRLYRNVKFRGRRFQSHDYGMVGLIKQLIDELGMDAITNPERGGVPPQRFPKFQRMEVCPGQAFIVKATEQDEVLLAESLLHPFPRSAGTV